MELKEPKKKKRIRLESQPSLPIVTNEKGEWKVYTAHLSASGTCIVDPREMEAIHSMGFFGKGSLSRSFPSFNKRRFGAPPIIRNRQLARRLHWLEELELLNSSDPKDMETGVESEENNSKESKEAKLENLVQEESMDISPDISIERKSQELRNSMEKSHPEDTKKDIENKNVNDVLRDSTEDEEICEIVEKTSNDEESSDDVHILRDKSSVNKRENPSISEYDDVSIIEGESNPYEVLVVPDTDSDTEEYLKNIKPRIENGGFPINETLHLTFEETFFLMYGLGCLQLVHYDGSVFSINNAWNYFQQQDKYFIQKYVVYHYFRSKGWIVKPGLKFGGDFLLYKQGPPFYHASYIVLIEVMDADTLIRDDMKSLRKVTWNNLIGLERLSETIAKELLFAQILWPSSIVGNSNPILVDSLSEFTVRELLWRRWNPKRRNETLSVDEADSDST